MLLGDEIDEKLQLYLRKVREAGGAVTSRIVIESPRGFLISCNKQMRAEFGGHIEFNRHWAYSLLKWMNFVKRKVTTSKSKIKLLTSKS